MSTQTAGHRSALRWTLCSVFGSAIVAAVIVVIATGGGATQGLRSGLALAGIVIAVMYFLVATRGRILLTLACSALPIFSCLGAAQGPDRMSVAWTAAAIGVVTVALGTLVAVWVANRWGTPRRTGLSDALSNWT